MAGRYEMLDSDEHRLPEGMQRVGYDADTQMYTYQDNDGSLWESEEGSRYGRLYRSGTKGSAALLTSDSTMQAQNRQAWRYMLPFFLLIGVFLLLVFRFLHTGSAPKSCGNGLAAYRVSQGDTCWQIATNAQTTVDDLIRANIGLDCAHLTTGSELCVPGGKA